MSKIMRVARRLAFDGARRIGKRDIATYLFCLSESFLPLRRIGRSADTVAFHHPKPSWEGHALVTPTRRCPALLHPRWPLASRAGALLAMLDLATRVTPESGAPYRYLIVNGGHRQDIGHLHGHLAATLEQAGFAGEVDPARDRQRCVVFDNVSLTPNGLATWLTALESRQQDWQQPGAGFSTIFPVDRHGTGTITIYVDAPTPSRKPS